MFYVVEKFVFSLSMLCKCFGKLIDVCIILGRKCIFIDLQSDYPYILFLGPSTDKGLIIR